MQGGVVEGWLVVDCTVRGRVWHRPHRTNHDLGTWCWAGGLDRRSQGLRTETHSTTDCLCGPLSDSCLALCYLEISFHVFKENIEY